MERFPSRLIQELQNLILQNPDIYHDFECVEDIIEQAKIIIGLDRVPTHDDGYETIAILFRELSQRELISLYLRLCERRILVRGEVNDILSQVQHEFIEYGDGLVHADHGIQEMKEGIQAAVDILEALDFNNTKRELQTASDDLTRGVWDTAVWRASKTIEGVCKEVARRYQASNGGTLNEPWRGMNAVQQHLDYGKVLSYLVSSLIRYQEKVK